MVLLSLGVKVHLPLRSALLGFKLSRDEEVTRRGRFFRVRRRGQSLVRAEPEISE